MAKTTNHKGKRVRLITAEELVRKFPSLYVDSDGYVRIPDKKKSKD